MRYLYVIGGVRPKIRNAMIIIIILVESREYKNIISSSVKTRGRKRKESNEILKFRCQCFAAARGLR